MIVSWPSLFNFITFKSKLASWVFAIQTLLAFGLLSMTPPFQTTLVLGNMQTCKYLRAVDRLICSIMYA